MGAVALAFVGHLEVIPYGMTVKPYDNKGKHGKGPSA
jgi:hypothetical protein